jgi:hypothetical protein
MKALSIRQPWAWAVLHAGKDVENRDWQPRYPARAEAVGLARRRARIAIHTGKRLDREGYEFLRLRLGAENVPWHGDLPRGGFVGSVCIVDVVTIHSSRWFFGPLGLVLRDAIPFPVVTSRGLAAGYPGFIRHKGALGFFDVPDDIVGGARRMSDGDVNQAASDLLTQVIDECPGRRK